MCIQSVIKPFNVVSTVFTENTEFSVPVPEVPKVCV